MANICTLAQRIMFSLATVLFALVCQALPPGAAGLLMYEQKYVNRSLDTNKIMALQNYQAAEYSPENAQVFEVKSYWIPAEKLTIFEVATERAALGIELERIQNGKKQILFLVHPESESFYADFISAAEVGPTFKATATASSRTLMMWPPAHPEKVFFGKLSLNKEIGGVVRTIPQGEVARSVGVSKILELAQGELPKNFSYLPEFFGAMPIEMERGGMLLRALPKVIKTGSTRIMPLFAVYTRPNLQSLSPIRLMIKTSGLSSEDLVVNRILRPFAKQWVELAVRQGITIEAHAQNVLMGLDSQGLPNGKFIYRDFGGFNIDLKFRRDHHLAMPSELPVITDESTDYHQNSHEIALRQSLGNYFEGGFLFGLGQELTRDGFSDLSYNRLTELLRQEVALQFKRAGFPLEGPDFYSALIRSVKKAKAATPVQQVRCQRIFSLAQ